MVQFRALCVVLGVFLCHIQTWELSSFSFLGNWRFRPLCISFNFFFGHYNWSMNCFNFLLPVLLAYVPSEHY